MLIILTLKFILAHVIGDFLIQPDSWIKDKEEKKYKSKYLYLHIIVHLITLLILVQFNLKYIGGILVICISHYIIDISKLNLKDKFNSRILFFSDQILHLLVIGVVIYYYNPFKIEFSKTLEPTIILSITAILVCTSVVSIIIKVIISKWSPDNELQKPDEIQKSLDRAGSYIGMLERLFIFGFILVNQWSGIGFLLAAKSVFRFGDLSKAKDRNLTEYILIGTLLSFGFAIVVAKGYLYLYEILKLA